jgi:predicted SnoaL-like aldol condensation-catalyzing enzyme
MTETNAARVMRRMVAAFTTGDTHDCHEYISASYMDHQGRGGLPLQGPAGFQQVVRAAHRNTTPHLLIEDVIANETRAVARIHWRFASPGQAETVERETIEIIRVEGGQAVEHWGAEAWSRTVPREAV